MLNTVAFIESIEPDFEYQGLEGAMSLVVENAENYALINDVIDEGAEIAEEEVFTEGVVGSVVKYVRKAIEWIIKNIKKAIAKLKSLFLSLVHKLKMAYLSAMRAIGKFAAKNLTSKHGGTVKVKWYKLKKDAFGQMCTMFTDSMVKLAEKAQSGVEVFKGMKDDVTMSVSDNSRNDMNAAIYRSEHFKEAKRIKEAVKEMTTGKDKEGGALFTKETNAPADSASLKDLYEKTLVKGVNTAYKKMMKANDHLLKAAGKAETAINKHVKGETNFGDNKKKHISTAKLIVKALNAHVNITISTNSVVFSAIYKTAVFALHQNIKATVYAIKRAVAGDDAYKYDKDAAKERANQLYGESADIEDVLA